MVNIVDPDIIAVARMSEICPKCGKDVCNGMGAEGMPKVNFVLQKFPSAKVFYKECCCHDMDFHNQIGFRKANSKFLKRMRYRARSIDGFWKRAWFWSFSSVIWAFVSGVTGYRAYKGSAGKCNPPPNHAHV